MRRLLSAAMFALAACKGARVDATPDGATRELVERLRRTNGDLADAKAAFELLSKHARMNLTERAQRYAAASGKPIPPEAMIAPARFVTHFDPQRYTAQIAGTEAVVEILGTFANERALVKCVYEDNGWRVDLALPPLSPVQLRPGASP